MFDFLKNGWYAFGPGLGGHIFFIVNILVSVATIMLILALTYDAIYGALDKRGQPWLDSCGTVVQHGYQAQQTSSGVGMAMGSNGPMSMVSSSTTPEQFILFVRAEGNGTMLEFHVTMDCYFDPAYAAGKKVKFQWKQGKWSGALRDKQLL